MEAQVMSERCQHVDEETDYDDYSYMGPSIKRTICRADAKYVQSGPNGILVCIEHADPFKGLIDLRDLNKKAV